MSKTILITGSTDGVGRLTALELAKAGHQIILHGRNESKLNKVIPEAKSIANPDQISGYVADLSDLLAVAQMADQVNADFDHIDVLINNAGIFKSPTQTNKDGIDIRMVVNYLAPYLLTQRLTSLLTTSFEPRVINLSSAAQASVSLSLLRGESSTSASEAYAQSKLALLMWSFRYAQEHPDITTIAVNPGSLLNTKMVQEAYGRHWSSADKGSSILVDLATAKKHLNPLRRVL